MSKPIHWITFAVLAIIIIGISDAFRKPAAKMLGDPFFTNFVFQSGSYAVATILFLSTRNVVVNPKGIFLALMGGGLVTLFSILTFKTLNLGADQGVGVSVVMPFIRIGGVVLIAFIGMTIMREPVTLKKILGIFVASGGLYLIFSK